MNLTVTFKRSKLARHILVLFLICALLPLLPLSFLADHLIDKGSGQIIKGVKNYPQPKINHYKALGVIDFQGIQHQVTGHFDHIPGLDANRTPPYDY